ncbi:putative membrane protein [Halorhabdus sp. SVX81]|uniref:DUF7519 family protein n=1 Tax=Halorhabdus sp. SVX81 TaxID=2978283 RepID=UPI0023DA062B|nr:hypothetical protein [Halorhabdus sp. SVX81]WEL18668.1 putative membrane protein [Halorhabdus sp. SVX81]
MSAPSRFTHQPGAVLRAGALVAALGVTLVVAPITTVSLVGCVIGVAGLAVGLTRHMRTVTGLGAVAVVGAVIATAFVGIAVERLLPAVVGSVLAWEFALGAFTIDAELDGGSVERAEFLHIAIVTVVASLVAMVAYVAYETLSVGVSLPGVALLVVAATTLALGLRD